MARNSVAAILGGGRIKIRHLQCLLEVIRQGSLTKAAMILGRTQPAVSKTLNELEQEVGVALLRRTRGGISLTQEGQDFYRFAGVAVSAVNAGLHSIVQRTNPGAAPVSLGCLPNVASRLMPDVARVFFERSPAARLSIITGSNNVLVPDLRNGDIELIVGRMPELDQMLGLTFQPLYEERQVFVVRPGHKLLAAEIFDLNDLIHYQFIMHRAVTAVRQDVDRFFAGLGLPRREPAIIMNSPDLARHYLRKSNAIWCVPLGVVGRDIDDGLLAMLPIDTHTLQTRVGITSRVEVPPQGLSLLLIKVMREVSSSWDNSDTPIKTVRRS